MGRSGRSHHGDRWSYMSCDRKKKFKSGEASKLASRFNQRKYECGICGHWHLTKMRGSYETPSEE